MLHRAKYALVIVSTILTEFREDQGLRHDIGCVLEVTLCNSSLQEKVVEKHL
jgi:Kyakuja-Dileera-Zisupton transposase